MIHEKKREYFWDDKHKMHGFSILLWLRKVWNFFSL